MSSQQVGNARRSQRPPAIPGGVADPAVVKATGRVKLPELAGDHRDGASELSDLPGRLRTDRQAPDLDHVTAARLCPLPALPADAVVADGLDGHVPLVDELEHAHHSQPGDRAATATTKETMKF